MQTTRVKQATTSGNHLYSAIEVVSSRIIFFIENLARVAAETSIPGGHTIAIWQSFVFCIESLTSWTAVACRIPPAHSGAR